MSDEVKDRCQWKRCRQESTHIYYGIGICNRHFRIVGEVRGSEPIQLVLLKHTKAPREIVHHGEEE